MPAEVDRITFHMWQQWLLDRQLTSAAQIMPLMQDLPIGFSPDGVDAWAWQDLLTAEMTVGASPDLFNATGRINSGQVATNHSSKRSGPSSAAPGAYASTT